MTSSFGSSSDSQSSAILAYPRTFYILHYVDQPRGLRPLEPKPLGQSHGDLLLKRLPGCLGVSINASNDSDP